VLDALYFTIITLTTVGYGDLAPQTDPGKIFTMVYIFVGLSLISGFIILLGEHSKKLKMIGKKDDASPQSVTKEH
jgi:voltage-gated potassium channel Kch